MRNFAYNSFNELETEEQCKLSCFVHPSLWLITWDPTQPVATRPLAIQKDGTWYTYGRDLTKNICEIFGQNGYIRSTYAYTPFGSITTSGDVIQPIQWSSEYYDSELALVYYNYRHYNPTDGRWINRDPIAEQGGWNLYGFVGNKTIIFVDSIGQIPILIPIILGLAVSSCSLLNNNLKYNFSASSFLKEVAECGQYFWGIEWRLSPTPKQYGVISQVVRFSGELHEVSSPEINIFDKWIKKNKLFTEFWEVSRTSTTSNQELKDYFTLIGSLCCIKGKITISAYAYYSDEEKIPKYANKDTSRPSLDLMSTYGEKPLKKLSSNVYKRSITISWNCFDTVEMTKAHINYEVYTDYL